MDKIIKSFENEIESLKNSIEVNRKMSKIVDNYKTSSIYEALVKLEGSLDWHTGELFFLKKYKQCSCFKLLKSIKFLSKEHQAYSYATIYKCKKCSGYFSR